MALPVIEISVKFSTHDRNFTENYAEKQKGTELESRRSSKHQHYASRQFAGATLRWRWGHTKFPRNFVWRKKIRPKLGCANRPPNFLYEPRVYRWGHLKVAPGSINFRENCVTRANKATKNVGHNGSNPLFMASRRHHLKVALAVIRDFSETSRGAKKIGQNSTVQVDRQNVLCGRQFAGGATLRKIYSSNCI